jgi:RNA polymerase sigma factor (sigma-70 family)
VLGDDPESLDVVNATLVKYHMRQLDGTNPIEDPKAWVFIVAKNGAKKLLATRGKTTSLDASDPCDADGGALSDTKTEYHGLYAKEVEVTTQLERLLDAKEVTSQIERLLSALNRLVDALDDSDREFLTKYYWDRLSAAELAAELNIKEQSVKTKWFRLACKLSHALDATTNDWPEGRYLDTKLITDPKHFDGWLNLMRLQHEKGPDELRSFVELFVERLKLELDLQLVENRRF